MNYCLSTIIKILYATFDILFSSPDKSLLNTMKIVGRKQSTDANWLNKLNYQTISNVLIIKLTFNCVQLQVALPADYHWHCIIFLVGIFDKMFGSKCSDQHGSKCALALCDRLIDYYYLIIRFFCNVIFVYISLSNHYIHSCIECSHLVIYYLTNASNDLTLVTVKTILMLLRNIRWNWTIWFEHFFGSSQST